MFTLERVAYAQKICQDTGPCSANYPPGTVVILTATPDPGSYFVEWSGDCTGKQPTCTLVMDKDKTVNAKFNKLPTKPVWR